MRHTLWYYLRTIPFDSVIVPVSLQIIAMLRYCSAIRSHIDAIKGITWIEWIWRNDEWLDGVKSPWFGAWVCQKSSLCVVRIQVQSSSVVIGRRMDRSNIRRLSKEIDKCLECVRVCVWVTISMVSSEQQQQYQQQQLQQQPGEHYSEGSGRLTLAPI